MKLPCFMVQLFAWANELGYNFQTIQHNRSVSWVRCGSTLNLLKQNLWQKPNSDKSCLWLVRPSS